MASLLELLTGQQDQPDTAQQYMPNVKEGGGSWPRGYFQPPGPGSEYSTLGQEIDRQTARAQSVPHSLIEQLLRVNPGAWEKFLANAPSPTGGTEIRKPQNLEDVQDADYASMRRTRFDPATMTNMGLDPNAFLQRTRPPAVASVQGEFDMPTPPSVPLPRPRPNRR